MELGLMLSPKNKLHSFVIQVFSMNNAIEFFFIKL
jgi:hypothetical protein